MSVMRLNHRGLSARVISIARLDRHKLCFHKKGKDGSGKCDITYGGNTNDAVYGVIFEMSVSQLARLDRFEGLGNGYEQKEVAIILPDEEKLKALAYFATDINSSLKPYAWYKEHVLRGAQEHGLPLDYIAKIDQVEVMPDLNIKRHEEEMLIYS